MKNYPKLLSIAVLFIFVITSCSKDPNTTKNNKVDNVENNSPQPLIQNAPPEESPEFELSQTDLSQENALLNVEAVLNYNYARLVVSPEGEVKKYDYILVTNIPASDDVTPILIEDFYNTIVIELSGFQVSAGSDYKLHLADLILNDDGSWTVRAIFMDPLPADDPLNTIPWDIRASGEWKAKEQGGNCLQSPGVIEGAPEILDRYILHNAHYFNFLYPTFVANPLFTQPILTAVLYLDPNSPQIWYPQNIRTMYYHGPDDVTTNFLCISDVDMLYYYNKFFYTIIPTELGNTPSQTFVYLEVRNRSDPPIPNVPQKWHHSQLDLYSGDIFGAPGPPLNF